MDLTTLSPNFDKSILEMMKQIEREINGSDAIDDVGKDDLKYVEFKIQANRIVKILDICIDKLELAFCLSDIIGQDREIVKRLCRPDEYEKLIELYEELKKWDESKTSEEKLPNLDKLNICLNIAFKRDFKDLLPRHIENIPLAESQFLDAMKELKRLAEYQISITAPKALNKEKVLHKIWITNSKLCIKIDELETKLKFEKEKLVENEKEKTFKISELKCTIEQMELKNSEDIAKEIQESNKSMKRMCIDSEARQKELAIELEKTKNAYDDLLNNNLAKEKKLRDQKLKTQQILQNCLNKYDNDVGAKHEELNKLRKQLKDEQEKFRKWKEEYDRQDIEYNEILKEKEIEENRIREEKLLMFMMNRAAITVQRAFRKLLLKRKGKKGKKGNKKGGKKK